MEILFQQMDDWYRTRQGLRLLASERKTINRWLRQCHGEYLLQIGGPSARRLFDKHYVKYHFRLSPEYNSRYHGPSVQGSWHELPLLPNTLDVVLVHHVLEYSAYPQQVLEEAARVLVSGGHLIVLSFNTYSFWGLCKLFHQTQVWPWRGKYWSAFRIRHWLRQSELQVIAQKTFYFRPPSRSRELHRWLRFLEPMGQVIWPYFGGVNIMVAEKTALGVTPIKVKRHRERVTVGSGYLEPTTRNT